MDVLITQSGCWKHPGHCNFLVSVYWLIVIKDSKIFGIINVFHFEGFCKNNSIYQYSTQLFKELERIFVAEKMAVLCFESFSKNLVTSGNANSTARCEFLKSGKI